MGAVVSGDCNEIEITPFECGKHREFTDAANFRGKKNGSAPCVGFSPEPAEGPTNISYR
jgi:hypothetical protein